MVALLLLLVPLIVPPGTLLGQGRELVIEEFDSDIRVRADGSFDVTETLRVNFIGSWNGLERELLFHHRTAEGRRTRFQLELGEVTDGAGHPLEVERSGIRSGIGLRIWVPDARDVIRTVVINYRVRSGLRHFDAEGEREGWDELYFDVTGHDWRVPITRTRARVTLPESLEVTGAWGYTGRAGSTEQAVRLTEGGNRAVIESTRPFEPGEGLTISVTWPAGVLPRATSIDRARAGFIMYWPLGLPILVFGGMMGLWHRKGRDPYRAPLMVEYEPPPGLSPAEVGTLVDHRAEMHDITSTLVDLAVRGYLRIEEVDPKRRIPLIGSRDEEWIFHQTRPMSSWQELLPHERIYIRGLFEPALDVQLEASSPGEFVQYMGDAFGAWREARREGRSFDRKGFLAEWTAERDGRTGGVPGEEVMMQVRLSELTNRFHAHLTKIRTKIYKELKRRGLYVRRPDHVAARWSGKGVLLLFGALALGAVASEPPFLQQLFPEPVPLGLGVALSGFAVLVVGQRMGVRTEEGSRVRAQILGFQEFLSRVESDYYDRVVTHPELFERYLPYAIALKVESRWAKAFEGIYREPPDWYTGSSTGTGFRASHFTASLSSLSTRAGTTMASSPGGSSGSGGGGSSGGGSGGGGGGGF